MKTDLDLLNIAIALTTKTDTAFAEKIGMTRQNLNRIKRMAELNNNALPDDFKLKLKKMYDIDIYDYQLQKKIVDNMLDRDDSNYKEKYIELLEKIINEKESHIRILEKKIPDTPPEKNTKAD